LEILVHENKREAGQMLVNRILRVAIPNSTLALPSARITEIQLIMKKRIPRVIRHEFCAILACPMLPGLCRHCNVILAEQCTKISDNDEEKWPLTLATKSVYDKIKFFSATFFVQNSGNGTHPCK
jgi:hypothetical protein